MWFIIIFTNIKLVTSASQYGLNLGSGSSLLRSMQVAEVSEGGTTSATVTVGMHQIKTKENVPSAMGIANDYSWVEAEESTEEYTVRPDDLDWLKLENEEVGRMFIDMSMSMPSKNEAHKPTLYPTFAPPKLDCPNTPLFTTKIRNREVNCELIKFLDKPTRELLCSRTATFNEVSQQMMHFCPNACEFDCTEVNPTPAPSPSKRCADNLQFETQIRNRKITCDVVRYQTDNDVVELLCARKVSYNGLNTNISELCPDACDYDCSQTPPTSCNDLDDFLIMIRNKRVTCGVVSFQTPEINELLCDRTVTYRGESSPLKHLCPEACEHDCTSTECIDDEKFQMKIANKDISCEIISTYEKDVKELLCSRDVKSNGKSQLIKQFCPLTCEADCSPTTGPKCSDDDQFKTKIANKDVNCGIVSTYEKDVKELLCSRTAESNGKSQLISQFCPITCETNCSPTAARTAESECSDDDQFKAKIANKDINCGMVSTYEKDVKELLCSRTAESNGKSQFISKFCPIACETNCGLTSARTAGPECTDDDQFIAKFGRTDINCGMVSTYEKDVKELLCSRTSESNGKSQLINQFCPIACGNGCFNTITDLPFPIPKMAPTLVPTFPPTTSLPTFTPTTLIPTVTPTTLIPTVTPTTLVPTRCPERTEAERREEVVNRYAASPSDISGSAQQRALDFVITLNPDPCGEDPYDIQRYVAAVFYYSTGGDNWGNSGNYLSSEDECNWDGILCNDDDLITSIIHNQNNLVGTLPEELQHLPKLLRIELDDNYLRGTFPEVYTGMSELSSINLDSNTLTGNLPTSMGDLQNLQFLDIDRNDFTGVLPLSMFTISGLEVLDINDNNFSGTLPPEFGNLSNIKYLQLYNNRFDGTIPASLGSLSEINTLYLHGNDFTGTMPEEVCALVYDPGFDLIAPCNVCGSCCEGCLNRGRYELPDFDPFVAWLQGWLQTPP